MSGWGRQLREFRSKSNMKQETLAALLRVSQGYVSRLEADQTSPNDITLSRIKRLLNEPQHQPMKQHMCRAVENSPHMVCLIGQPLRKNIIAVSSACTTPVCLEGQRAASVEDENYWNGLTRVETLGAFSGEIASAGFIWRNSADEAPGGWHTICVPMPLTPNEWVVHTTCVPISETEFADLESKWSGKLQYQSF